MLLTANVGSIFEQVRIAYLLSLPPRLPPPPSIAVILSPHSSCLAATTFFRPHLYLSLLEERWFLWGMDQPIATYSDTARS